MPIWLALAVCALGLGWAGHDLRRQAAERGVAVIDPRSFRLQTRDEWVLPEWEEVLGAVLARAGVFSALDREAISALTAEVRALPFVAEVGEPEVVWPDGLLLDLRLRAPVACVAEPHSGGFLPVASDGMILPGRSSSPHRAYGGWLPVLETSGVACSPGERLTGATELEALSVAVSLWDELAVEAREALGRVRIDATRGVAPDGLPGGIVIDLEQRRRLLFGRAPSAAPPGELPSAFKWAHVARAMKARERGEPWDTYDVRWDEPVVLMRVEGGALRVAEGAQMTGAPAR